MKRLLICLATLLVVASASHTNDPPEMVSSQPSASAVRATRLHTSLNSATGNTVQVYLYAPDERVTVQDVPSCMAEPGDTVRSGTYKFYTSFDGGPDLHLHAVSPFEDEQLSFNDQRPNYLEVLQRPTTGHPDLLMLMQYGSCNGNSLAILAPSPDGTRLVQYRFKTDDGTIRTTVGTKVVEHALPGSFRTSIYNNATGQTTTTTWEIRDDDAEVVAVKTEVQ